MAAVTGAVLAVGMAGYQIYNAEQQKKLSKQEIQEFQRQDLVNPFENIQVSTLKSEQQTDANLSNYATSVDALQRGGSRSVLAGINNLNESNILLQNIISQDLDNQANQRDLAIAQAEQRNQDIIEQRESLTLQGLGQQYQTARQDSASGLTNLVSGALALGTAMDNDAYYRQLRGNNINAQNPVAVNTNTNTSIPLLEPQTPSQFNPQYRYDPFRQNSLFGDTDASLYNNNPFIYNS